MAAGYPVKVNYLTGDVLTAADLNDLAGTVNLYDPTAKGDLFPASAADAVSRLAVGANDTVLTADSTTATGMKWAAGAGGGGMTLISTTEVNDTASNYTISSIPTTYNSLLLVGINTAAGSGTSLDIRIQLNSDTGANYNRFGFGYSGGAISAITGAGDNEFTITGAMALAADAAYMRGNFMLWINNAKSSTTKRSFQYTTSTFSGGGLLAGSVNGSWNNVAAAVSTLKFYTTGANIKTGTFLLYGLS